MQRFFINSLISFAKNVNFRPVYYQQRIRELFSQFFQFRIEVYTFWLIWYSTKRAYVIMICPSCIVVIVIDIVTIGSICAQPS